MRSDLTREGWLVSFDVIKLYPKDRMRVIDAADKRESARLESPKESATVLTVLN